VNKIEGQATHVSIWRRGRELFRAPLDGEKYDLAETLSETDALTFEVETPEPDVQYRFLIGDFPYPATHQGRRVIEWSEDAYLDSARGLTPLTLQSASDDGPWRPRLRMNVWVLPTKATEAGYLAMLDSLTELASGLALDIAAKSRAGLGLVTPSPRDPRPRSPQVALKALEIAWGTWANCIARILQAPETRLRSVITMRPWSGAEPLPEGALQTLLARGIDPLRSARGDEVALPLTQMRESFQTREHAFIGCILAVAERRAQDYALRARAEIAAIEADRPFRDRATADGASLYQSLDLPRLEVLHAAAAKAVAIGTQIGTLHGTFPRGRLSDLRGLGEPSPVFDNVPTYRRFRQTALAWLATSWTLAEFGERERLKPTWRMYEQWVFLSIASALRTAGLRCVSQRDFAEVLSDGRYSIDLERGARLEFQDANGRRLRLSYEPWILPLDLARARGDRIYQGSASMAAWSPDILIEALPGDRQSDPPHYGIVIDAKYSRSPHRYAERLQKYLRIRSVDDNRQVVRQVWAASPAGSGIVVDDEVVKWSYAGPSVPLDEQLFGYLAAAPGREPPASLREWTEGTLIYLGYQVHDHGWSLPRSSSDRSREA
jgi:hypothetical protein